MGVKVSGRIFGSRRILSLAFAGERYRNKAAFSTVNRDFVHEQNPKIDIGGYKVNYIKAGQGPHAVFCFPGVLGSMRSHLPQLLLTFNKDPFMKDFTLVAWDQPGYGLSRPPDRVFTDDSMHEDAHLAVQFMKVLGFDKFSVMGWSGGGCSALLTAIQYPEIVRKLIVWGAFAYVDSDDAKRYEWFSNPVNMGGKMKDVLVEEYGEEFFNQHFSMWMRLFARIYTKRGGDLCANNLSQIKCPTLVVHGSKDQLITPIHGQFLSDNIPNATLHLWTNGKHNVHLRYPQEFHAIIHKFLLS